VKEVVSTASTWWWPTVDNMESTKTIARRGAWAALVSGTIHVLGTASTPVGHSKFDVSATIAAYVASALFIVLGLFMFRLSRTAATLTLALQSTLYVLSIATGQHQTHILPLLFTWFFVNSVRGAFAYHRLVEASTPRSIGSH